MARLGVMGKRWTLVAVLGLGAPGCSSRYLAANPDHRASDLIAEPAVSFASSAP